MFDALYAFTPSCLRRASLSVFRVHQLGPHLHDAVPFAPSRSVPTGFNPPIEEEKRDAAVIDAGDWPDAGAPGPD
jgi:hypothetical protein